MDYLFETTDSVFEILWDVALAFFIVRIALSYFFFTFTTTTLLSWIIYTYRRYLRLPLISDQQQQQQQQQQHLTVSQTELFFLAVLFLQTIIGLVVARYVVAVYDVPRVASFRLAIGGLATAFLAGAEGLLGLIISAFSDEGGEHGRDCWIWQSVNGWMMVAAMLGGSVAFAAMPVVLMWFERSEKAPVSAGRAEGKGGDGDARA
ncbi:uncharacterized protein BDZ83DRAFT_747164 [Colletotrichum acutatum]|uniref:Uncharacterized protein n=1 Tax=Glomerella acutata TaxID=27357 RepID=A0AAD8XNQ9_GLOAC|nr:uncharacterized protein BDZ83DRAFT_747164 [Colletotrichum acutatum]KAK1730847.1 hypothetical protein BDZ83DRAFT_747164 [Colletotrichum acutatum]